MAKSAQKSSAQKSSRTSPRTKMLLLRGLQFLKAAALFWLVVHILTHTNCRCFRMDKFKPYFIFMTLFTIPLLLFLMMKEVPTSRYPAILRHFFLVGVLESLAILGWLGVFVLAILTFKDQIPSCCARSGCNLAIPLILLPAVMATLLFPSLILACLPSARRNEKKKDEEKTVAANQQRAQGSEQPSQAFAEEHRGESSPATYASANGSTTGQAGGTAAGQGNMKDNRDQQARMDERPAEWFTRTVKSWVGLCLGIYLAITTILKTIIPALPNATPATGNYQQTTNDDPSQRPNPRARAALTMPRPARTAIHQHFTPLPKGAEKVPRVHCNHCPWQGKRDVTRQEKHLRTCRGNLAFAQDLLARSTNPPGVVHGSAGDGSGRAPMGYQDAVSRSGGVDDGEGLTDPRLVGEGAGMEGVERGDGVAEGQVEGDGEGQTDASTAASLVRLQESMGMAAQGTQGASSLHQHNNGKPGQDSKYPPIPQSTAAPTAEMTPQHHQQLHQQQQHARILNPQEKRRIDILYARAIVAEGGTFDLFDRVGHPHMYAFLKALSPEYEPPTRAELGGLVVEEFFQN
ncbi:MAG: hypothetical protein M1828_005689 [Chrysothrix sp. TS-e1954]|nr:MAG: hypothetical protein M1828_005689 [Chrysothrix sp. TS-e1954]